MEERDHNRITHIEVLKSLLALILGGFIWHMAAYLMLRFTIV